MRKTLAWLAICSAFGLTACGESGNGATAPKTESAPPAQAQAQPVAPAATPAPPPEVRVVPVTPWKPSWNANVDAAKKAISAKFELPADAKIRPTFVPGMYSIWFSGRNGGMYFSPEQDLWGDLSGGSWKKGDRTLSEQEVRAMIADWVPLVPRESLLLVDKGVPASTIVFSAVDCPSCATLEEALDGKVVSYLLAPRHLRETGENTEVLRGVVCSAEPQKAWRKAMVERVVPQAPACDWDVSVAYDVAYLMSPSFRGATPSALLPDGSVAIGKDAVLAALTTPR